MNIFRPTQLINVGAHIGSSKQCWNTLTSRFISGYRKGITLINLGYTSYHLRRALLFVKGTTSKGGIVIVNSLYINTHIAIINKLYSMGQIVAPGDWIGGYLSNYRNLKTKIISKRRSRAFVSALINLNYNIDNRFISSEARNLHLPIVSIFDTNSQCSIFDYPIPTNNKNSSVRTFYAFLFSSSVFWGIMKRVISTKRRVISTFFQNGRIFRKSYKTNFFFDNPTSSVSDVRLINKKIRHIYAEPHMIKLDARAITPFITFTNKFVKVINKRFILFKSRFLHNEIVTNFDIIGIFISRALENIMYRAIKIEPINRFNFKERSKAKLFLKKYKFRKTFFVKKRLTFIIYKCFKKFDKRYNLKNANFFGFHFVARNRKRIISVSKIIALTFFNFFCSFNANKVYAYPWRKEFLHIKRFSKIFRFFMTKYRRDVIRKVFFKIRKTSKFTIKKSKVVKKYKFNKRNLHKKFFNNINFNRINRSKFGTNKRTKNVGRWNRTATVSFSGLYSTIELSRL